MRILIPVLAGVLALAAAGPAPTHDMANMSGAPAAKTAQASGVIKRLDPASDSITVQHGQIASLGWPAMTMAFKVRSSALLNGLQVGQTVDFTLEQTRTGPQIIAIRAR